MFVPDDDIGIVLAFVIGSLCCVIGTLLGIKILYREKPYVLLRSLNAQLLEAKASCETS